MQNPQIIGPVSFKKTNIDVPEWKGPQRDHRGPGVDSGWSGKPHECLQQCVYVCVCTLHAWGGVTVPGRAPAWVLLLRCGLVSNFAGPLPSGSS